MKQPAPGLRPVKAGSDIENVEIVFKDGVGYDAPKLLEFGEGV